MADSYSFAVDVFRCIGERLSTKATELELLAGTSAFEGWLAGEAFLACKQRQGSYPFCEVEAKPTYASEGVTGVGDPDRDAGDLRVGGPDDGANHCWLFAEFMEIRGGWRPKVAATTDRLKRLGWKKSAALLIAVAASRDGDPPDGEVWDRPTLTAPVVIPLPGGGAVILTAFDIKRDPTDTLTGTGR